MAAMTGKHQADLEDMIDKYGLADVLSEMALICHDKAEHIRVNWQDASTAHWWDISGNRLIAAANRF